MASFLQSEAWERAQERLGHHPYRDENGILFLRTDLPLRLGQYLTASRFLSESGFALPATLRSARFLRLEPENEASLESLHAYAATAGLRLEPTFAVQPRQTVIVDLTADEETLLARMKQKHRYNLKVAHRNELRFETVSQCSQESFARFWSLLEDTANRQGFRTHAKEHYRSILEILGKEGQAHLLFVSNAEEDLATMLLITHGDTATYLHGGSSAKHKEQMAPYLLHFEAMRFAKGRGCTTYDLWGTHAVFDETKQEWTPMAEHPSAGTTRLKLGFGGTVVTYPGTFDLVLNPFCYTLYKILRALRGAKRAFA